MKTWYFAKAGGNREEATEAQLPSLIAAGRLTEDMLVWTAGMGDWVPARQGIAHLFQRPPLPGGGSGTPPSPSPSGPGAGTGHVNTTTTGVIRPNTATRCHNVDYEILGDDMQIVEVELDPSETVIAEAGAMNYMEDGITFEAKMGDGSEAKSGFLNSLMNIGRRVLTGESIFMTHFTNKGSGKRRVAFAAPYPGKIIPLNLAHLGGDILCEKDAFLCAAFGTKVDIAFQKRLGAGFFGGEGFILQRLTGDGMAFVHSGGTIVRRELRGQTLRVDTGCLVAMTTGVEYNIERAGNLKSMFFGGEGLFLATVSGHGTVWLQSLPFSRLADRIIGHAPSMGGSVTGEGSVLGGLGRILGGS